MKKAMLGLAVMALVHAGVYAQAGGKATGEKRKPVSPTEAVARLDAIVNLREDQKPKVLELATARDAKMKALKAETTADKEALKAKRMEINKAYKTELGKVLDAAQKEKLKAHREAMKKEGNGPHKMKTADEVVMEIDAVVKLRDDQKAKIKTLAETKNTSMKALMAEKKSGMDEEALKAKRKEIGKSFRTGVNDVLDESQRKLLAEHRKAQKSKYDKK